MITVDHKPLIKIFSDSVRKHSKPYIIQLQLEHASIYHQTQTP